MTRSPLSARLEALEGRCNPAGTVVTSFDAAGNYLVVGDGLGNELRFEDTGGGLNLVGENGTTVTGPALGVSGRVTFRLGGGDDRLLIAGGIGFGSGLRVDLGSGNNSFEMTGAGYTINGAFDIVQAGTPGTPTTASVKLASQPGDTFAILGGLSYTSTGRVDDTFEIGLGNANNAFISGPLTARLGAGNNSADLRLLSSAGLTVTDASVPGQSYFINAAMPTVRGDVVATLGAGGGEVRATHDAVQGRFAVTNDPASRSTVGVTATLGEVAESFTVRSRSVTQGVVATFTKIGGNLSVVGGGRQFTNFSLTGGEVVGAATVTTNQPAGPNTANNQSLVNLTATTLGGAVSVTNTAPRLANTTVDVDAVGRDLRVTARGTTGTTTIDTDTVGRAATVTTTGVDAQFDLGTVTGVARVGVTGGATAAVAAAGVQSAGASTVAFTDVATPTLQLQQAAGPVAVRMVRPTTGTVIVTTAARNVGVSVVGGTASDVTVRDSAVAGDLTLTATGDTTNLSVQNVAVTGDLVSRALGRTVVNSVSGGSVGGQASFTGGDGPADSFRARLDDLTVGSLVYTGGAGRNFLDLDTLAGLTGRVRVAGASRVVLGGGNDEVTFGGLTTDPVPVPNPDTLVEFLGDVFVNGGPGTDLLFNRNATVTPPAELTTLSIDPA